MRRLCIHVLISAGVCFTGLSVLIALVLHVRIPMYFIVAIYQLLLLLTAINYVLCLMNFRSIQNTNKKKLCYLIIFSLFNLMLFFACLWVVFVIYLFF